MTTDEQTIDQIEFELRVRCDERYPKDLSYRLGEKLTSKGKPIPIPVHGFPSPHMRGMRTKKAFLRGAERKLRNAVRREKAQYLHEREAQTP